MRVLTHRVKHVSVLEVMLEELVKRMVAATDVDAVGEDYYSAMLDAHRALRAWKDGAESWEEFSRRAKA